MTEEEQKINQVIEQLDGKVIPCWQHSSSFPTPEYMDIELTSESTCESVLSNCYFKYTGKKRNFKYIVNSCVRHRAIYMEYDCWEEV